MARNEVKFTVEFTITEKPNKEFHDNYEVCVGTSGDCISSDYFGDTGAQAMAYALEDVRAHAEYLMRERKMYSLDD